MYACLGAGLGGAAAAWHFGNILYIFAYMRTYLDTFVVNVYQFAYFFIIRVCRFGNNCQQIEFNLGVREIVCFLRC